MTTTEITRHAWGWIAGWQDTAEVPARLEVLERAQDEAVWLPALHWVTACAVDTFLMPSEAVGPVAASLLSLLPRVDAQKRERILSAVEELVAYPSEHEWSAEQLRWSNEARDELLLSFRTFVDLVEGPDEATAKQAMCLLAHCGRHRPGLAARIDGIIRACAERFPNARALAAGVRPDAWERLRAFGDPEEIPRWLDALARAEKEEAVREASHRLEAIACDLGVPCEATPQVVAALVSFLPALAGSNRSETLSLLEELTCGRGRDGYDEHQTRHLAEAVMELCRVLPHLEYLAETLDERDARECVDLLAYCAELRPKLAQRVDATLERAAARLPELRPEVEAVRAYYRAGLDQSGSRSAGSTG